MLRYVSELRTVSFDAQVTVHRDKLRNYFISKWELMMQKFYSISS